MRRARRPWCLVLGAGVGFLWLLTETGEILEARSRPAADRLIRQVGRHHVIFAAEWRSVCRATGARQWSFRQRRHRVIDATLDDGPRVVKIPGVLAPGLDGGAAFARYMFWLADRDVWPTGRSSWSTLGRHLWLATLPAPVRLAGPPRVGRRGFYGGRKDVPFPARYRDVAHYDLRSAYPHALGSATMPARLRRHPDPRCIEDPERDGLALAVVDVDPALEYWPPLPVPRGQRNGFVTWDTGRLRGWWTFAELRAAQGAGCRVRPVECWCGTEPVDAFGAWLTEIRAARRLDGDASRLAKSHANALWSSFAVAPAGIVTKRFTDDLAIDARVVERRRSADFTERTAYVSSLVAGRVRARVFAEALAPAGACNPNVIYVDTDGVMAEPGALPQPAGDGLGEWRQDRAMVVVEIRCPQVYRWCCATCGDEHPRWHYSVAGAPSPEGAALRFRDAPRHGAYDEIVIGALA